MHAHRPALPTSHWPFHCAAPAVPALAAMVALLKPREFALILAVSILLGVALAAAVGAFVGVWLAS